MYDVAMIELRMNVIIFSSNPTSDLSPSPREQLGASRYLVSDGLFIAKALNRTLVEFPAANARISGASSALGCGAYWDFDSLCR